MASLAKIVRNAFEAGIVEYVSLVEKTARLLASEKGSIGSLTIDGRLVRAQPSGQAIVVGDLHGDLESLVDMMKASKFIEKASHNSEVLLVFLGDYGDRGSYSAEVYYVVLKLKQLFPEKVVLMRGNHEGPDDLLAHPHDLPQNLQVRFGKEGATVYSKIRELFAHLYNGVGLEDFCVMLHGGVPSQASSLEDLKFAHLKHPEERHLEEILWSDPDDAVKGTQPSPRGAGRRFGEDVTQRFLDMLNVKVLIRGHESAPEGFRVNHHGKVLTLFSRKGLPYHNVSGAYLQVDLPVKRQNAHELEPYIHKI
ncbi:MAG: metallophosphoesterase family protein [Candidatus Bathyarchaeia archaeon]